MDWYFNLIIIAILIEWTPNTKILSYVLLKKEKGKGKTW